MGREERVSTDAREGDTEARAEALRQAAVFASGVLAIRSNDALLAIVARASALLGTPMAAMSIIDRDRQWFPVAIGLPEQTPRSLSFCAYAILTPDDVFCVPDACADPRFVDNDLVTSGPRIRFYAGAPLVDGHGQPLGALCAIDHQPREPLSPQQQAALVALAAEAMAEIGRAEECRGFNAEAIEHVVAQIRAAARADDEPLLLALDRIVQSLEASNELPLPPGWPAGS